MAMPSALQQFELLGKSPAVCALREDIACAARSEGKVLISGESGSGKEIAARLIHLQVFQIGHGQDGGAGTASAAKALWRHEFALVDEMRSRMVPEYWKKCYAVITEGEYPVHYAGVDLVNSDTDGDGIRDGADDQDHDDVPNVMECSRTDALGGIPQDAPDLSPVPFRGWDGFVNPFNPCLPHVNSRTCKKIVPFANAWAPFNSEQDYYLALN